MEVAQIPPELVQLGAFYNVVRDFEKKDSLTAYAILLHIVTEGVKTKPTERETRQFLSSSLMKLEQWKNQLKQSTQFSSIIDNKNKMSFYLAEMAERLYNWSATEEAKKSTNSIQHIIKSYFLAYVLLKTAHSFDPSLPEEYRKKMDFCLKRSVYLKKGLDKIVINNIEKINSEIGNDLSNESGVFIQDDSLNQLLVDIPEPGQTNTAPNQFESNDSANKSKNYLESMLEQDFKNLFDDDSSNLGNQNFSYNQFNANNSRPESNNTKPTDNLNSLDFLTDDINSIFDAQNYLQNSNFNPSNDMNFDNSIFGNESIDFDQAQKLIKYASSAILFKDVSTTVKYLKEALLLLTAKK